MKLEQLKLSHFRLYTTFDLHCHPHINIIVGDNAQGKTTILEAIHMLAITKSHKTPKDTEVIQTNAEFAKIHGLLSFENKPIELDVVLSKHGKKAKYNRIEAVRLSDYLGSLNIVMFAPEDLELVKGSPLERRRFMDLELGKLKKTYLLHLNNYRRILKERNEVLKGLQTSQKYNDTLLEILTEQLIHYGRKIVETRQAFIEDLNARVKTMYFKISGETLPSVMRYQPSVAKDYQEAYKKKQRLDIQFGTTHIGPHRDDFAILIEDLPFKNFASQGQIRTMVLAIKLSMVERVYQEKKVYPIVLLDDVFSELDRNRQLNLLTQLNKATQLFFTTTDVKTIPLEELRSYQIITISEGTIKGVNSDAKL